MTNKKSISDKIVEHERKLQIVSSNFKNIDIDNISGGDGLDGTENAQNINLNDQSLELKTSMDINGISRHTDLPATITGRNIVIDTITNNNSVSLDKVVIGSGSKSDRRSVDNLDNKITPISETQNIKNNGDTITMTADIEFDKSKDISEVAIKLSNGDFLQYDTV